MFQAPLRSVFCVKAVQGYHNFTNLTRRGEPAIEKEAVMYKKK